MMGRAAINRLQNTLDATFQRAREATFVNEELRADLAKYLVVRISGYVEQALIEILLDYARKRCAPSIHRYVDSQVRKISNINGERLSGILGSFDPAWSTGMKNVLDERRKNALDSVIAIRNRVAHGENEGVTLARAQDYYGAVKEIVDQVAKLCAT